MRQQANYATLAAAASAAALLLGGRDRVAGTATTAVGAAEPAKTQTVASSSLAAPMLKHWIEACAAGLLPLSIPSEHWGQKVYYLGASVLPEAVAQAGMGWLQFHIEDDAAPGAAFDQAWAAHRDALCSLIASRSGIAIHGRGRSGRTGLLAALMLREIGMDGLHTDAPVKRLRPNALRLPHHLDYLAAHDGRHTQKEDST